MSLLNHRFRLLTTKVVLVPFLFMAAGGHSYAQTCAARQNPVATLERPRERPVGQALDAGIVELMGAGDGSIHAPRMIPLAGIIDPPKGVSTRLPG